MLKRLWSLLPVCLALGLVADTLPAGAEILPAGRRTTWNPGIPGGVPRRTTVCANINAVTYGNGTIDATAGIQAAINACPEGQVVQLSAGDFLINGASPISVNKGIVLRGAGPSLTKLRKTNSVANPVIVLGKRWVDEAGSVNLTANAAKGATSVQVTSAAGFSVGQLVLVDKLTDDSFVFWGLDDAAQPGGQARGWFTRYDRPVGQMVEVAAINGNTISFTTPLHIAFDTAHTAQLTRYTIPYGVKYGGVENLYVRGGRDDNILIRFAMYSWVKNIESDMSMGDGVGIDSSFRCIFRDSYVHDTPDPAPGGNGYMLSLSEYTSDTLVENSIFMNGNKVMVMRASGGGNVIGYNYFDNGYIDYAPEFVETGMNASHMACPHFELFEGNQAFNIGADDYWGGAVYITYFRNHATGKRRSFTDTGNRRAIGIEHGHYYYSFVGNVLGTATQSPAPFSGFAEENFYPWYDDPIGLWKMGYTQSDWDAPPEARVVDTAHRHGNFDYASNAVRWAAGYDQTLPNSLYLTSKPSFFANKPWPWVVPTQAPRVYTLPARARYDLGTPNLIDDDVIFADGFESAGLGSWSASASDPGDLTVSVDAAMALSPVGLRAVVNDPTGTFVQDDTPNDENRFRARFYFDPNSFNPGEAQAHFRTRIFLLLEENPNRRLAAVVLKRQGGNFSIMGRARQDDNSQVDTGFFPITDAPHFIEIDWRRASGPSTNDGMFQLYIDGVPAGLPLTGLDNSISAVDFTRLGALSVKSGAAGTLFWDEYFSRRTNYIGP